MGVQRNDKSGKFCAAWSRTSHKAQLGGGRGSVGDLGSLPLVFGGGEGVEVYAKAVGCVPGGGCDTVLIGWTSVSMICGVGMGVGGSRYCIGIPKVNPGRLRVTMTGLLTIPEGGKRKGIMCMGNEPQ